MPERISVFYSTGYLNNSKIGNSYNMDTAFMKIRIKTLE